METSTEEETPSTLFRAKGKRLGVFVISYNAEQLLVDTLRRIPDIIWEEVEVVYVVDDCSTDETTKKALEADNHGGKLKIFRNRVNQRYGGNQKYGYQYAIDRGLDAVVMLHGDGQYAPELLPAMFRPLVEDHADVVIGSRMIHREDALKGGMPKYKFMANIFLTDIENALAGTRYSEFHSGYRGYSTRFLRRIPLWENSDEWHFDSHILFQARQADAKIVEFPIPTHYGDEVCHVNGIGYGLACLRSAFLYRLHRWHVVHINRYDIRPRRIVDARKLSDPHSSHSLVYRRLVESGIDGKRVLDLGFGCAAIASELRARGASLDGIDHDPRAVQECGDLFDHVYEADLNELDEIPLDGKYDIILAADILHYLHDPSDILSRLKKRLRKGGTLVVSLPNFVNLRTRLRILTGHFPLHHRGILDEQALHFYTLRSMRLLLQKTGWRIDSTDVTSVPLPILVPAFQKPFFRPFLILLRGITKLLPGLLAFQGILYCSNPNESDLL